MCGICGIISQTPIDSVAPVRRMQKALYHRGPDGAGAYQDESVALGFQRLSIIDLSGGWQPLYNEDKTHYSLTSRPGSLTITTQRGGIFRRSRNAKNIFLLENPLTDDEDFVVETLLTDFHPFAEFQQAGLLCFD